MTWECRGEERNKSQPAKESQTPGQPREIQRRKLEVARLRGEEEKLLKREKGAIARRSRNKSSGFSARSHNRKPIFNSNLGR